MVESPRWVASAEALWLDRSVGASIPLGFAAFNNGSHGPSPMVTDTLYSDDALFPLATGTRLQIGARLGDERAIQATYWGMQQWTVGNAIYGDSQGETVLTQSPWLQTPALIGGMDNFLGYAYTSRVDSAEINERIKTDLFGPFASANWVWGFRYFRLADAFTLTGSDIATGIEEDLTYRTKNDLVGLQGGIQWVRGWDRFQLTTEAKFGLLANFYTQRGSDVADGPLGAPSGFQPFDVSHNGAGLSALFELSLLATYRVSPHWWLRAGYQFYAITGLALGPRQLPAFDHGGTVALDGLSLGLETGW